MVSARQRDPAVEEQFMGALYKGGELLASGKVVEAREHLEKAHHLEPRNEKAQNLLGLTYFKLGLFDEAAHVYELLVRENPADPTLRVNLGLVYLKTQDLDRSVKEFETATDLEPGHKKAHNYLGLALAQQGDYERARDHFLLAGSDQMAEKMERAVAGRAPPVAAPTPFQSSRSSRSTVMLPPSRPSRVAPPPPPPPSRSAEEAIEMMSDEERPPDDAEVLGDSGVREAPWSPEGATPPPPPEEALALPPPAMMEDERLDTTLTPLPSTSEPVAVQLEALPTDGELMPMLEANVADEAPQPAWLSSERGSANGASPLAPMWVTETVADVPLTEESPVPQAPPAGTLEEAMGQVGLGPGAFSEAEAQALMTGEGDRTWGEDTAAQWTPSPGQAVQVEPGTWEGSPPEDAGGWDGQEGTVPSPGPQTWAGDAEAGQAWAGEAVSAPEGEAAAGWDGSALSGAAPEGEWEMAAHGGGEPMPGWEAVANQAAQAEAASGWDTGPVAVGDVVEAAAGWEAGTGMPAEAASWEEGTAQPAEATGWEAGAGQPAEAASWEAGPEQGAEVEASAASWERAPVPEGDGSWEGLAAAEPVPEGSAVAQAWDATAEAGAEASASWEGVASAQPAPASEASWETGAEDTVAREAAPPPAEPEAGRPEPGTFERVDGVHDTEWVMQPVSEALRGGGTPRPSAPPPEATIPPSLSVGFTPLKTQRLTELGATAAWVQEPSAGPFQLGPAGLAVSVHGEMLSRMTGLVAVVGSVESEPEMRHRRGRPTGEPFGNGGDQLQRMRGHGVLYLEATRSFHSIDLTDQPEEGLDDDGAYVREELVFAFEEGLSFENGRLANETESLDLVHLKGSGRVLFRLEGDLNAMPIPAGTPTVVPVARLVGWFGRVTPRLMGFGGQGAVELTGEGYALLLT